MTKEWSTKMFTTFHRLFQANLKRPTARAKQQLQMTQGNPDKIEII